MQNERRLKLPQFDGQFISGFALEPCSTAYRRSYATGDRWFNAECNRREL